MSTGNRCRRLDTSQPGYRVPRPKRWYREEATGTCAAHQATTSPSIIVIGTASIIVPALTVGKDSSINRINQRLRSFDEWTAESIDQRQAILAELAKDVWKTSLIEA